MSRKGLFPVRLAVLFASTPLSTAPTAPHWRHRRTRLESSAAENGCDLRFAGSSRRAVKLRKPGFDYTRLSGGRAVSDFFSFVCTLDP